MNDPLRSCETRAEEISLLAAGCLTDREENELRQHLATCDACRERFAEIASLCSGLRSARPAMDADSVRGLTRFLSDAPSPARTAGPSHTAFWQVAMLALVLLVMVGVLSRFTLRSTDRTDTTEQQTVVPEVPQVTPEDSRSPLPTLFALRRAAAESDESLDRLLAQYSGSLMFEPVRFQSLAQELVQ